MLRRDRKGLQWIYCSCGQCIRVFYHVKAPIFVVNSVAAMESMKASPRMAELAVKAPELVVYCLSDDKWSENGVFCCDIVRALELLRLRPRGLILVWYEKELTGSSVEMLKKWIMTLRLSLEICVKNGVIPAE